jgi:IS5 family transposase
MPDRRAWGTDFEYLRSTGVSTLPSSPSRRKRPNHPQRREGRTGHRFLIPVIEQVKQNLGRSPNHLTADAGYMSDENAAFCDSNGIDAYLSVRRDRHGTKADTSADRGEPDKAAWVKMRAKLDSDQGSRIYRRRKATVEPVFGQIKDARGFRHFLLRGLDKVRHEWELVCMCHNLLKLVRLANGPLAAI